MKLNLNFIGALALATIVTLTACGDDPITVPPVVETNEAPTLLLQNPDMSQMMSSLRRTDLPRDTRVELQLVAADADGNLQALTVDRNGAQVTIPTSNVFVEFDGNLGPLDNNPRLLVGADTTGFTKTINVRTAAGFGDSVTYTFTVNDTGLNGANREEASVTITLVNEAAPTPLAGELMNREFYNRSDPSTARPGALDLDSGDAMSSSMSTMTELQDQGNGSTAWLRQIAPENGASLRYAGNGASIYDGVTSFETLLDLYDASGSDLGLSDPINAGDVFVVTRNDATVGSKFYVVIFTEATDAAGTSNDKYVVSIKQN